MKGPKSIIVMRHGEKTDDPNDAGLSPIGKARAQALPQYFLTTYGKPDYIFATANSERSKRPYKTVKPLAKEIDQEIHTPFENDQTKQLALHLLLSSKYSASQVLVCWHHGEIPTLLKHLGVEDKIFLAPWPTEEFDLQLQLWFDEHKRIHIEERRFILN